MSKLIFVLSLSYVKLWREIMLLFDSPSTLSLHTPVNCKDDKQYWQSRKQLHDSM